jgi:hypothetical protein
MDAYEQHLINEISNNFLEMKMIFEKDLSQIFFLINHGPMIVNIFIFIFLFIIFFKPIKYIVKEFIIFITYPKFPFVLFCSGNITYLLYSLIQDRKYENVFLLYAFVTTFLLMYNIYLK